MLLILSLRAKLRFGLENFFHSTIALAGSERGAHYPTEMVSPVTVGGRRDLVN